ncbi:MAG: hypothetical protein IJZ20_06910, partial [Clostridia bacterium]|nr:hypothetical protein [Clostridia bacterium]
LIGIMSVPSFAADTVKAGEKAIANFDCTIHKNAVTSGYAGTVNKGDTVEVAEAYITGEDGSTKFHKLVANLYGNRTYRYIEAYDSDGNEALSPYTADNAPQTPAVSIETETASAWLFVDSPVAGEMPDENIEVTGDTDMEVEDCEWKGEFDADGSFKEGVKYTIVITLKLGDSETNKVFSSRPADHGVNRFPPTIKLSNNNRTVELTYNFAAAKAPKESTAPKKEGSENATSVKVDKFAAGDFGTMKLLSGGYSIYHEPDSRTMYGNSQNTEATITVLEAGIDGVDTDAVYYAIWNERLEEVDYVNMNDAKATFGNFVKEGNDPERPYNEKFAEKRYKFKEITEIDVNFLHATVFSKPYMSEYGTEEPLTSLVNTDTYACTGVVYSTTEVPEPYSVVTANENYVAKDSYNFSKDVKSTTDRTFKYIEENGKHILIVNTYSINHINEKTIELVYHVYIDPTLLSATKPTQAMKDYYEKHKHERGVALPVIGTAKVSEHFSVKFDNNIWLIESYLWKYPMDIDEDKYKIQPNQTVEI